LLAGYGRHALATEFPLLRLALFRIRTFRASVAGSFLTRLGAGGVSFLLPLLYQVGLGYTPIQSAMLIIPQPLAAMGLKAALPQMLARFGYRQVLVWNTIFMGVVIVLFSTIVPGTPVWLILSQAFLFGFCSSMQYSSMNTLAYADVPDAEASKASAMASTMQQMSLSFGVAVASLTAAEFIPAGMHGDSLELIHGIHLAFIAMGILTMASAAIFFQLKSNDGDNLSRRGGATPGSVPAGRLGV
jgi:hypothetical protein